MKIKCIVCGFEKEVDNGIYQKDIEAFHLSETGHQGWTTEIIENRMKNVRAEQKRYSYIA